MPESKRSSTSQSKHDQEVSRIAREYKKKGYDVRADIPGYPKPREILGCIPDVSASKGKYEAIVEVETQDSVGSSRDILQQGAFRRAARRNPDLHFKRKIV